MELTDIMSEEPEMPIPLTSNYSTAYNYPCALDQMQCGHVESYSKPSKKLQVKYKECLRNHAASIGGNATDGCGEFMPSAEGDDDEDTNSPALTCSACNCHRNFHRKVVLDDQVNHPRIETPHPTIIVPYNMIGNYYKTRDDHQLDREHRMSGKAVIKPLQVVKKRFRTKFTQDQKENMRRFAAEVGWRMHKQQDSLIQSFCQEIGVSRRVFKVWMHNNKHNLAKKKPDGSSLN